jgi:hypothetical protein
MNTLVAAQVLVEVGYFLVILWVALHWTGGCLGSIVTSHRSHCRAATGIFVLELGVISSSSLHAPATCTMNATTTITTSTIQIPQLVLHQRRNPGGKLDSGAVPLHSKSYGMPVCGDAVAALTVQVPDIRYDTWDLRVFTFFRSSYRGYRDFGSLVTGVFMDISCTNGKIQVISWILEPCHCTPNPFPLLSFSSFLANFIHVHYYLSCFRLRALQIAGCKNK